MLMMQYKLEPANGASTSCFTKVLLIEKVLQYLSHLTKTICSVFYNISPSQLTTKSDHTQHLQYEVVRLNGEVNMRNSTLIKKEIFKIILNNKSVLLDMSKLNIIDSSGIATLVESLHKAHVEGLKYIIVGANNLPLKMLELSKLDKVFKLFNSIQDVQQ